MTLRRLSLGLSALTLVATACGAHPDGSGSGASALGGDPSKRPMVVFADAKALRPPAGTQAPDATDAPDAKKPTHLLIPFVLPPPPKDLEHAPEGAPPALCVLHHTSDMPPIPLPPMPPAKEAPEASKLSDVTIADRPLSLDLALADGGDLGATFTPDPSKKEGDPIIALELATFAHAPTGDAPPRPDIVIHCFAPPGAGRIDVPNALLTELLAGDHAADAHVRITLARLPAPPPMDAATADACTPPPPPADGAAPPKDGPPKDAPPDASKCPPPPMGHGVFAIVPMGDAASITAAIAALPKGH